MTPEKTITLDEQLAHTSEAKDVARRMGLSDAFAMECAIESSLQKLKLHEMGKPEVKKHPPRFNEDEIGRVIRLKIETQGRIHQLEDMVRGANQPENIAGYEAQLREKRVEMKWINAQLVELKKLHIEHLNHRISVINAELEQYSCDAWSQEELKGLKRVLEAKIEAITNEIRTYETA